jgi:hypothetical protein
MFENGRLATGPAPNKTSKNLYHIESCFVAQFY